MSGEILSQEEIDALLRAVAEEGEAEAEEVPTLAGKVGEVLLSAFRRAGVEAEVRPVGEPGPGEAGGWWWKLAGEGGERLYLRLDLPLARVIEEKADPGRFLDPGELGEHLGKKLTLAENFREEGGFSPPGQTMESFSLQVTTPAGAGRVDGYLVLEESPPRGVEFAPLEPQETVPREEARNLELLFDVPLTITVELGRTEKTVREVLSLVPGSVVELDRLAGEAVDVLANGRLIARGEVVVVEDSFGVRITEIVSRRERLQKLA